MHDEGDNGAGDVVEPDALIEEASVELQAALSNLNEIRAALEGASDS